MSTSLISGEGRPLGLPTLSKPLDETVWQAWLAKNRVEERRNIATRIKLLKVVALVLLAALVVVWQMRSSGRIADLLLVSGTFTGMIVEGNHWGGVKR
jgi:hypothetical protein